MTPLREAVERYLAEGRARFHMPGHKGVPDGLLGGVPRYDITEIPGIDSLYEADGPIAETERLYSKLYGTAGSFLSAGGSTLCIQAMLALAVKPGGKLLCGRGVHTAAVNAMTLLDLRPVWLCPEQDPLTGLASPVAAEDVDAALREHPDAEAVYITSPTYYGLLSDISAIAEVCRRHGVPLLVDNAHGAHLKFLRERLHPIALGADLCCDSLHKTLPVLTGGALLHVGNPSYLEDAKRRLALFGSTSPSFLILLSADGALPYLRDGAAGDLARVSAQVSELEELASRNGFLTLSGRRDPIRLTVGFTPLGFTAASFRAYLNSNDIEPEFLDGAYCVFLAGSANSGEDFVRLRRVVGPAPFPPAGTAGAAAFGGGGAAEPPPERRGTSTGLPGPLHSLPERVLSLREAVFAPSTEIPVERAAGRIAASAAAPCPPGIPIVLPGERISQPVIFMQKNYGVLSIPVLK